MIAKAPKRKAERIGKRSRCPVKPGDKVTCRQPVDAYYSSYGGRPECTFKLGMVGIVAAVDVPSVRYGPKGEDTFVLVDFTGPEYGRPQHRYTTWRVALRYRNILPTFEPGDCAKIDKRYSKWRGKTGIVEKVELFAEACELHGPIFHVHVRLSDLKHGEAVEAFSLDQLKHGIDSV